MGSPFSLDMTKEDCFNLGHVSKTFGFQGEVVAFFDVDQPEEYDGLDAVLIEEGDTLLPIAISHIQNMGKGKFRIKFEGVDGLRDAERLVKTELYLPLQVLPKLSGKNFYFHEVIGFKAIDNEAGEIGIIDEVLDYSNNPIISVKSGDKQVLIPAIDEIIDQIDRKSKAIYFNTPAGLLDLYLSNKTETPDDLDDEPEVKPE